MLRYIALRLILLVPVLLGVSLIVFLLLHMGNAFKIRLEESKNV